MLDLIIFHYLKNLFLYNISEIHELIAKAYQKIHSSELLLWSKTSIMI